MDINELESYRLSDAVKFNDHLNPRIWGPDERMLPEVREALLAIAEDFKESLGIDLEVKDITVSGSNAAYTYTPHSDVDLHLVADLPKADSSDIYRELFDAKKYQYNDQHDFKIGGYDVELYVQNANEPHVSQGIYSVLNNEWLRVPSRKKPTIDDISVKSKYEDVGHRIDQAIKSGDLSRMDAMAKKIRTMRQTGLAKTGEFGPENLAFKVLRSNGTLDRLRQARQEAKSQLMSLTERKKKKRSRQRYGKFGGMWFPGYGLYGQDSDAGDIGIEEQLDRPTMDPRAIMKKHGMTEQELMQQIKMGVQVEMEHTKDPRAALEIALDHLMELPDYYTRLKKMEKPVKESPEQDLQSMIEEFADFAAAEIGLESRPQIKLKRDPAWSQRHGTFGKYMPDEDILILSVANRHPMDVMRTLAHEFVHHGQEQDHGLPDGAGETGSRWEDEANARAGEIMRNYAEKHPEIFGQEEVKDLDEGWRERAAAVAAAACVAGAPGCATTQGPSATDVVRGVQTVGRTAQTMKGYGVPGAKEELTQIIKDRLRKGTGTRESVEEPSLDDPIINYDIPYSAIARPERLHQARRFGRISHYASPGTSMAIISVPVSKERAFIDNMRTQGIEVRPSKVYESSGYIPTEAEQNDPRYKMALTVDVHPGQTGKEANKLNLKTDSQGRPQLLMKRLANLLESVKTSDTEDLFEVKMSPGELQRWAESDEAQGIQAGFEAELIFRDTARDDGDEGEYEPDYEQDERAYSIDQVVRFFQGGDNGIGPRTARNLETGLQEEFWDWQSEAINDAWEDDAEQLVRDYMETTVWADEQDERIRNKVEEMFDGEDVDAIMTAGEQAPTFTKLSDQEAYAKDNELYQRYQEALDAARAEFEEEVEREINEQGGYWDEASENFADMAREDGPYDEENFFSDRYRYMTDIADAHGIDWPYWTGGESSGGGGRLPDDIAGSLSRALDAAGIDGSQVKFGGGYHSIARKPGRWIIEPDGSLDPDDSEDAGLEVVSPPMPLPQAMKALRTVIDWANGKGDAYTNSSTGLHMGISIPYKGGAVDYVKLVLFMGDQHVLDQFDRAANSYCRSALEKLQDVQKSRRGLREQDTRPMTGAEKTAAAMDLMRKNLVELAQRYVQDGVGQSKYTSAHMKDGYIEFRSPGGDYLAMDKQDEQALGNTMLRFARAMQIAGRPDLERREYSKKLYKLLSGFRSAETAKDTKRDTRYRTRIETEGANDALELFAKYSSGMINAEELKKQWAEQVLAKEQPAKPDSQDGTREYEVVRQDTGEVVSTFRAYNDQEALENAQRRWSDKGFAFSVREKTDAEPEKPLSRRAEIAKRIKERPSIWRVTDTNTSKTIIVAASGTRSAKFQAADSGGEHWKQLLVNDPDSMLVEPASAAEVKQYQEKMADQEQDSAQVQQRVQGTGMIGSARYRVSWTERRDGEEIQDSLNIEAPSAEAARDLVRRALEAQGRDVVMRGDAQLVGSTQDLAQQRAAQAERPRQSIYTGQWTGRWQVKDRQGRVVYTFSGVGNSQSDANRTAHTWLLSQGDRFDNQGPFDVVPEMG